jgi:hypothetical protein
MLINLTTFSVFTENLKEHKNRNQEYGTETDILFEHAHTHTLSSDA